MQIGKLQKKVELERQTREIEQELQQISNQYEGNKDEVVELLIRAAMDVKLEIPRVVKMKIKKAVESDDDWDM